MDNILYLTMISAMVWLGYQFYITPIYTKNGELENIPIDPNIKYYLILGIVLFSTIVLLV